MIAQCCMGGPASRRLARRLWRNSRKTGPVSSAPSNGPASFLAVSRHASVPFALPRAVASILPGIMLVFLPKCPLCLAAWLTVATGVGFSTAGAAWVRGMLLLFWVAAVALTAARILRRRTLGRAPASVHRSH